MSVVIKNPALTKAIRASADPERAKHFFDLFTAGTCNSAPAPIVTALIFTALIFARASVSSPTKELAASNPKMADLIRSDGTRHHLSIQIIRIALAGANLLFAGSISYIESVAGLVQIIKC